MAPRVSGGVAHAIAVGVVVAVDEGRVRIQLHSHLREKCGPDRAPLRPDNLVSFLREIRIPEGHSFRARLCSRLLRVREAPIVVRFGVRYVATSTTATDAPTITRSMLDLCSAPFKARRFAPPAPTRGLRALTVPARRSGPGNYVMVGVVMIRSWTDLDR
jgi:hypothetical protein